MHLAIVEVADDAEAIGWRPGDPGLLPLVLAALHRWIGKFDPVAIPELEASGRAIVADQGVPPELKALWDEDEANAAVVLGFSALVVEELMILLAAPVDRTGREGLVPQRPEGVAA